MKKISKLDAEALRVQRMLTRKKADLERLKSKAAQIELDIKELETRQKNLPYV